MQNVMNPIPQGIFPQGQFVPQYPGQFAGQFLPGQFPGQFPVQGFGCSGQQACGVQPSWNVSYGYNFPMPQQPGVTPFSQIPGYQNVLPQFSQYGLGQFGFQPQIPFARTMPFTQSPIGQFPVGQQFPVIDLWNNQQSAINPLAYSPVAGIDALRSFPLGLGQQFGFGGVVSPVNEMLLNTGWTNPLTPFNRSYLGQGVGNWSVPQLWNYPFPSSFSGINSWMNNQQMQFPFSQFNQIPFGGQQFPIQNQLPYWNQLPQFNQIPFGGQVPFGGQLPITNQFPQIDLYKQLELTKVLEFCRICELSCRNIELSILQLCTIDPSLSQVLPHIASSVLPFHQQTRIPGVAPVSQLPFNTPYSQNIHFPFGGMNTQTSWNTQPWNQINTQTPWNVQPWSTQWNTQVPFAGVNPVNSYVPGQQVPGVTPQVPFNNQYNGAYNRPFGQATPVSEGSEYQVRTTA